MPCQPMNLKEALFPVITANAVIGHGIFRNSAGKQLQVFSVIYASILMFLYLTALYYTLRFSFGQPWYDDYERTLLLVVYANVGIFVLGVLLSWSNAKRFARITEELTKIDETLHQLGATFNYAQTRNEGYALIVFWIIMIMGLNWFDVLWLFDARPIGQIFLIFSVLHYPAHAITIVATNFSTDIKLVGRRYRKTNTILEGIKRRCSYDINTTSPIQTGLLEGSIETQKHFIQILKHVHLKLGAISKDLCDSYGLQVALNIASLFVMFTGFLYLLYNMAVYPVVPREDLRMVALGIWVAFYFIHFLYINEASERVCAEAHRTGEIIHCISQEIEDPELTDEVGQFSLQLIQDPLVLSPAQLINLGHRFVLGFVETVTTYLVIIIQMSPPKDGNAKSD